MPILFFSGAAYEAEKKRGLEAGANAYVIKPDLNGLPGRISQFVPFAKGAAQQLIPAERAVNTPLPLSYENARASSVG